MSDSQPNHHPQNSNTIGELLVDITISSDDTVSAVQIHNSRPVNMGRLLVGKTPQQALSIIPKLFLLCSQAQQCAAFSAMIALKGEHITNKQRTKFAYQCALEWLKEHCWQLWQMERELFTEEFAQQESLALSRYLMQSLHKAERLPVWQELSEDITELLTPLFGCSTELFSRLNWDELIQWSNSNAPYAQLFKTMLKSEVNRLGSYPEWSLFDEEGPLFRQSKHPLVKTAIDQYGASLTSRTLAKLIEIVIVLKKPESTLSNKAGTALTSRGELHHQLTIDTSGFISSYSIDAPTDRNFSSQGLLRKALQGQKIPQEREKWIRQLIWSIDPCVAFQVSVKQQQRTT